MPRRVTIVIPAYNQRAALERCLESCRLHASGHDILVMDDASPEEGFSEQVRRLVESIPDARYVRNATNHGYLRTCNRAVLELDRTGQDVLLLNSDTEVTEGFLEEMLECLYASDRHGVCSPRSDNATILTVPGPDSHARWLAMRERLPRYSLLPTGVGFCLLVRRSLIDVYGLFDEAYNPGYNEENDFCCRINRHGYSAVAANRAFVFHRGSLSFSPATRAELDARNAVLLRKRYPEYPRIVQEYERWHRPAADHFSLQFGDHRPVIAIDLTHLGVAYNGTSEYVLRLLEHLPGLLRDQCEIRLILDTSQAFFVNRRFAAPVLCAREARAMTFDLVFIPYQLLFLASLSALNRMAPRIVMTVHDEIAVRCHTLRTTDLAKAFRVAMRWADAIIAISEEGLRNTQGYLAGLEAGRVPPSRVILHGMDPPPAPADGMLPDDLPERFVFLVGNAFQHKRAEEALAAMPRGLPVIMLGKENAVHGMVRVLKSGNLRPELVEALYRRCAFVLFPSAYEGFGLPVLHAMRHGKAAVVTDLPQYSEMEKAYGAGPFLRRFRTFGDMRDAVTALWEHPPVLTPATGRTWEDCARDTAAYLMEVLESPIGSRLEERFEELRTLEATAALTHTESLWIRVHRHIGHGLDRWPRLKRVIRRLLRHG